MPTLRKPEKRRRNNDVDKLRRKVYMSQKWRNIRLAYLMSHPLCEVCMRNNKTTPAEDVHHKETFTDKKDWQRYAYDSNNLQALCKRCHGLIHTLKK